MRLITIDFETYYDRAYSLSKLTTEEYIRSPQFEVIGVAVKVDEEPARWYSGNHEQMRVWFKQFDWGDCAVLAHNCMFDAAILSWVFDIHPPRLLDTLSMARALHGTEVGGSLAKLAKYYELGEKGSEVIHALGKRRLEFSPVELAQYGSYCINDTELTYALFAKLAADFPHDELSLIDLTLKMFTEPVLELDLDLLQEHLDKTVAAKAKLLEECGADKATLMSNPKFAELLKSLGVNPPLKISRTTNNQTFAFAKTDEGMKELLEHPDLRVQTVVSARLGVKSTLEETRTQRMIGIAQRGSMPVPLRYCAAHTTRWGGSDNLNLQNLPSRGANANTLKRAIRAPEGHVVIDADSSQIEARTLAWLAGQDDLLDAFREGKDVYKLMASRIYGKPEEEISREERFCAKATVLGCGYGMGFMRFKDYLKMQGREIDENEANEIVSAYRNSVPKICALWGVADRVLQGLTRQQVVPFPNPVIEPYAMMDAIRLPSGLFLRYPELAVDRVWGNYVYRSRTGLTSIYGAKVIENVCQAVARCVIGAQMLRIAKRYRIVMTVHDAIACVVPKNQAEAARTYIEECMRWSPPWAQGLPLNCESGVGKTYGDC